MTTPCYIEINFKRKMDNRIYKHASAISLLLILLAFAGCNRNKETEDKMNMADSLMTSRPDSALAILSKIDTTLLSSRELRARYALLKSMALDKNYIDTTSFIILKPAINYYLKHGSPDEQLRTYYYQGRIYQNRGEKDSALICFIRGRDYCQESSDTLTMANLIVAQAGIQYTIHKYDDFIANNIKAANLYKAIGRPYYEILSLVNALDGSIINNNKSQADSIMSIAKKRVAQKPEFRSVIAPYHLSYVLRFGNRKEVFGLLKYFESLNSIDDVEKIDMAEAYYKIGQPSKAKHILDAIPSTSKSQSSLKYLALKPFILEDNGDIAGALHAYKKLSATIDSIHMSMFSHDILFLTERHEKEKKIQAESQRNAKIIWGSLSVSLTLLVIICFIYFQLKLGKAKNKLEAQAREKLVLEQDNLKRKNENLESKNRQFVIEKQNLQSKIEKLEDEYDSLKEILEQQKDFAAPIEDAIKVRIEMLNGLLASRITDNDSYAKPYEEWEEQMIQNKDEFMNSTRLAFKTSHPKFIEYLEQHGLTVPEINIACLYAIGLRGKEVGEYIQKKRHYHVSSDIRQKLGLDEHQTNLGIYIRKLMKHM